MPLRTALKADRFRTVIGPALGFAVVLIVFVASGLLAYVNTRTLNDDARKVSHTHEVLSALDEVLSMVKDAETGQRGFLITADNRYLEPYIAAIDRIKEKLNDLERLTADNPSQKSRVPLLRARVETRLGILEENLRIRREEGFDAASDSVKSERGRQAMDSIRNLIATMEDEERRLLDRRIAEMAAAYAVAVVTGVITCVLGVILAAAVAYLVQRTEVSRRWQEWLQRGQIRIGDAMVGDPRMARLGEGVLSFFAEYLDARAGAFFVRNGETYQRVATYGVPASSAMPVRFVAGDGLLGQAVRDGRTLLINQLPDNYLNYSTALGHGQPRHLMIVPVKVDRVIDAVFELGFHRAPDPSITELIDRVSEPIGAAVRAAAYRENLQSLLEETQRQAEELQAQGEELRVSNEELEEQSRALKESQSRLEQQQAELEQTNAQLEEQAQLLEAQRDEAARARSALQLQARELEQASRYKSDFLANMSHELRTPLNSSLILAKLLADNSQGNLTDEQVQYARTIQSAGNDLLMLINDILDLSKIEAGHMEIRPETVRVQQLIDDLTRTFRPIAEQKSLSFQTRIQPGTPDTIETDRQRIEQVLKNLLSNAMKFTERGEVSVTVSKTIDERIAFAVTDTGIGIAEAQQQMVFEAFRQADGTTNRKFGGTGLGLSISRELTRLLGGEIGLSSVLGRGSTFTVTLPERYDPDLVRPAASQPVRPAVSVSSVEPSRKLSDPGVGDGVPAPVAVRPARRIEDDRATLTGGRRVLLVVEDDEPFARILFDLAHELGFQCLIATTAEEGRAMAVQYLPSAVVLDVGLPDHSGLSVLDRLKHDTRTRHIPVHVVSAGDHTQTALALGAVGYMLKPVKREDLEDALRRMETRLSQRMRRVLVVEDDPVQRDSLQKLLGSHDVETVGAGTAADCLAKLKEETFDCMVLDLSLPDASGYSLLETLSHEDAYAFPPVIVYTGRALSADEEQQLRRYSKSIIIKGAKSPERLLDEVTLFLHQVVSELPAEQQRMLEKARSRDAALEGRRILVVEDDVRNVFALTSILEPRGADIRIARNGREALEILEQSNGSPELAIDLVLMDVMMPEMDGITATREIRKRPEWRKLPILILTAKAMKDDHEMCLSAGANDYMAKPLEVEKLLSLVRVWMPR